MTGNNQLTIRVRTKKGVTRLQSLNGENSVQDLKFAISDMTGVNCATMKILYGYPPRALSSNESTTLDAIGLKDGELLTLDESAVETVAAASVASASLKLQTTTSSSSSSAAKQTTSAGRLMRKVVPANNSCLFTSVNFLMENGRLDLDCQRAMRELIAKTVKNDPDTFNEAILGKKNAAYCDWIRDAKSWGGSIEIMILSKYYKCEICVVDIRTNRIDRFGEDCAYPIRVFIIYDGIHFDPLYLEADSMVQTIFSTSDDLVMLQALEIANEAKNAHQYTDVSNFKLKCLVCQQPLKGQKAAQEHAEKTGHINFGEINNQ